MDNYKELTFVICIIIEAIKFCCTYIYLFENSTLRNSTDFIMFNCQNKIWQNSDSHIIIIVFGMLQCTARLI